MNITKTILLGAIVVAAGILSSFNANHAGTEMSKDYSFEESTFADLKAVYGDNIVDQNGNTVNLADDAMVNFATPTAQLNNKPCTERPCASFQGYINNVLVRQANDCCCSFRYGIECCNNGSLIAILYLIEPTDPACGL